MASETIPATRPSAPGRAAPPSPTQARSEWSTAFLALGVAAGAGALLQAALPCGRCAAPFVGASFAVLYAVIAGELPARWRRALMGQEAFAAILATLASISALGTLVVQGQSDAFYRQTYGPGLAATIVRLGLDDAFHSLWFAGVAGVFCGSVVVSAARRWPLSRSTVAFHLAHLGLLMALAGAAASSAFAVRGWIELRAGESTGEVKVRTAHRAHPATAPDPVPLGFTLRLDRFEVEPYRSALRIGYYERQGDGWRLRASFDPEPGAAHRLPDGASFAVRALREAPSRAAFLRLVDEDGALDDRVLVAGAAGGQLTPGGSGALVLEPRPMEVREFRSFISAIDPGRGQRSAVISVNAPFRHLGWTLYQASYDPAAPHYSALEAVHDPGALWVFAGFALIAIGVAHALLSATWLRPRSTSNEVSRSP